MTKVNLSSLLKISTLKLNLILGFMICLFISCAQYQRVSYSNSTQQGNAEYQAKIEKYKAANKRILYNAYLAYIESADLTDKAGKVTEESIWSFKQQFEPGAKIVNDIQLYPSEEKEMIDASFYADLVATFMPRKGVVTKFDKPDINTFFAGTGDQFLPRVDDADENDEIFFYTYETTKKNFNILNKNNQVLYYEEAIEYPIVITFRISIKNQNAEIVSILPQKN